MWILIYVHEIKVFNITNAVKILINFLELSSHADLQE